MIPTGLDRHAAKLFRGIGPFDQHVSEGEEMNQRLGGYAQAIYISHLGHGSVAAHVIAAPCRPGAAHGASPVSLQRLGEVLEGCAADDEINACIVQGQSRGVAEVEADVHSFRVCIMPGNFDKSFADVGARTGKPRLASSIERKPGPGATSSTWAEEGIAAAMRTARDLISGRSFRVVRSYQRAVLPSMPIPLYALAVAVIYLSSYILFNKIYGQ